MYTPESKRRRLNTASDTLSKPFRSPLKTSSSGTLSTQPNHVAHVSTVTVEEQGRHTIRDCRSFSQIPRLQSVPQAHRTQLAQTVSAVELKSDPSVAPLIKLQRELERQLRDLKDELETTEQARKIEKDSEQVGQDAKVDGGLIRLIQRWRGFSRSAADELFGPAKDKINKAGGPKAWREAQAKQKEWLENYNAEPESEPHGDTEEQIEGGDSDRDIYTEYSIEPETENEKEARGGNDISADEPEDEFTMAAMLHMLNIDMKVIGYDREMQRWSD